MRVGLKRDPGSQGDLVCGLETGVEIPDQRRSARHHVAPGHIARDVAVGEVEAGRVVGAPREKPVVDHAAVDINVDEVAVGRVVGGPQEHRRALVRVRGLPIDGLVDDAVDAIVATVGRPRHERHIGRVEPVEIVEVSGLGDARQAGRISPLIVTILSLDDGEWRFSGAEGEAGRHRQARQQRIERAGSVGALGVAVEGADQYREMVGDRRFQPETSGAERVDGPPLGKSLPKLASQP